MVGPRLRCGRSQAALWWVPGCIVVGPRVHCGRSQAALWYIGPRLRCGRSQAGLCIITMQEKSKFGQ